MSENKPLVGYENYTPATNTILTDLSEMTVDQARARMVDYFQKSSAYGMRRSGVCDYQTHEGTRCAVGCLLHPEDRPAPQGACVLVGARGGSEELANFAEAVQILHDTCAKTEVSVDKFVALLRIYTPTKDQTVERLISTLGITAAAIKQGKWAAVEDYRLDVRSAVSDIMVEDYV